MLETRETVQHPTNGRPAGFVERMASGSWRGYRYDPGIGYGPFFSRDEAVRWVKGTGEPGHDAFSPGQPFPLNLTAHDPVIGRDGLTCLKCNRRHSAAYLGPVWERFTKADGSIELRKLFAYYRADGERQFAPTEAEALRLARA